MCSVIGRVHRVIRIEMHIKFYTLNLAVLPPGAVQVKTVEPQSVELVFQRVRIDAEINQCADEHVAANSAEKIEIECIHSQASELIVLAA